MVKATPPEANYPTGRRRCDEYQRVKQQLGNSWEDTTIETKVDGDIAVIYSPAVVNKINEWSTKAEIKWLTNWKENAKNKLAPALGLNDFPVLLGS